MRKKFGFLKISIPLIFLGISCMMFPNTLAYYRTDTSFINDLSTEDYSSLVYEVFNPPDDWKGEKINKDLFVENTGDITQVVRIRYMEQLSVNNSVYSIINQNGEDLIIKGWTDKGIFTDNWSSFDDWYYYNYPLNTGDKIQILDFIQGNNLDLENFKYTLTFEVETIPIQDCKQLWNLEPIQKSDGSYVWENI